MVNRDFDQEFGDIMVGQAATDPDLVGHYRDRIFDSDTIEQYPSETNFVKGLVRWQYPMSERQMNQAIGRCVAGLIDGVELGKDVFKDVC